MNGLSDRIDWQNKHLFSVFVEIKKDVSKDTGEMQFFWPKNYDTQSLCRIVEFSCPAAYNSNSPECFTQIFTSDEFVDFLHCRYSQNGELCLTIRSAFPYFQFFYKLLERLSEFVVKVPKPESDIKEFLSVLHDQLVPSAGEQLEIACVGSVITFSGKIPHHNELPQLRNERYLQEFVARVPPACMALLFGCLLMERPVLIVSQKVSVLSSCIFSLLTLLYPLNWQNTVVVVTPDKVWEIACTGMCFLTGLLKPKYQQLSQQSPIPFDSSTSIFDADTQELIIQEELQHLLPYKMRRTLEKRLRRLIGNSRGKDMMGDMFSRIFLRSVVQLIGGYRRGFIYRSVEFDVEVCGSKEKQQKEAREIKFEDERFIETRPELRDALQALCSTMSFLQFRHVKEASLSHGIDQFYEFEQEAVHYEEERQLKQRQFPALARHAMEGGRDKILDWSTKVHKSSNAMKRRVKERVVNKPAALTILNKKNSLQRHSELTRSGSNPSLPSEISAKQTQRPFVTLSTFAASEVSAPIRRYELVEGNFEGSSSSSEASLDHADDIKVDFSTKLNEMSLSKRSSSCHDLLNECLLDLSESTSFSSTADQQILSNLDFWCSKTDLPPPLPLSTRSPFNLPKPTSTLPVIAAPLLQLPTEHLKPPRPPKPALPSYISNVDLLNQLDPLRATGTTNSREAPVLQTEPDLLLNPVDVVMQCAYAPVTPMYLTASNGPQSKSPCTSSIQSQQQDPFATLEKEFRLHNNTTVEPLMRQNTHKTTPPARPETTYWQHFQ